MEGEKGCDMKAAGPLGAFEAAEPLLLDVLAAASLGLEVAMQPGMGRSWSFGGRLGFAPEGLEVEGRLQ